MTLYTTVAANSQVRTPGDEELSDEATGPVIDMWWDHGVQHRCEAASIVSSTPASVELFAYPAQHAAKMKRMGARTLSQSIIAINY